MTDLRTAAQQALEALEQFTYASNPAITALKAALAAPVQETVAWIHTDPDKPVVKFLEWREDEPGYRGRWIKTPLYTAPPQRKPLTEEELDALAIDEDGLPNSHIEFARAIERAHGITS